jgi:hypothetical protein
VENFNGWILAFLDGSTRQDGGISTIGGGDGGQFVRGYGGWFGAIGGDGGPYTTRGDVSQYDKGDNGWYSDG